MSFDEASFLRQPNILTKQTVDEALNKKYKKIAPIQTN